MPSGEASHFALASRLAFFWASVNGFGADFEAITVSFFSSQLVNNWLLIMITVIMNTVMIFFMVYFLN
jgi:hypothetical protein